MRCGLEWLVVRWFVFCFNLPGRGVKLKTQAATLGFGQAPSRCVACMHAVYDIGFRSTATGPPTVYLLLPQVSFLHIAKNLPLGGKAFERLFLVFFGVVFRCCGVVSVPFRCFDGTKAGRCGSFVVDFMHARCRPLGQDGDMIRISFLHSAVVLLLFSVTSTFLLNCCAYFFARPT